jgi:hypothetical protein
MDRMDVQWKLKSGEYKVIQAKGRKSAVWDDFNVVVRASDQRAVGFVQCRHCPNVLKHSAQTGTSGMLKHDCPSKGTSVRMILT